MDLLPQFTEDNSTRSYNNSGNYILINWVDVEWMLSQELKFVMIE